MSRLKLDQKEGDNGFCGPAALSLLTGRPVQQCVEILQYKRNGDTFGRIRGVFTGEMRRALCAWGYEMGEDELGRSVLDGKPTIAQMLRRLKGRDKNTTYLVVLPTHFMVLKCRLLYDNHFPDGVFLRKYPHRRRRVSSVHLVKVICRDREERTQW